MRLIVALFVLKVEFELKFLKSWTTERNLPLFFSAKGGQINREATHSRIMRTTPDNNRCVPVGLLYNIMCVEPGVLAPFKRSSWLSRYEKAAALASAPPYLVLNHVCPRLKYVFMSH